MNKINFQNGTLISKAKVTIGGTVYEVEPEEYEGTTPLNAENMNQIQTNAENAINAEAAKITNISTYATTERAIGKWIDGKTLYEITLTGTKTSGTDLNIDLTSLSIDTAFIVGGSLLSLASSQTVYSLDRYESASTYTRAEINTQKTNFHYTSSTGNYTNGTIIAIIRYTKTTD